MGLMINQQKRIIKKLFSNDLTITVIETDWHKKFPSNCLVLFQPFVPKYLLPKYSLKMGKSILNSKNMPLGFLLHSANSPKTQVFYTESIDFPERTHHFQGGIFISKFDVIEINYPFLDQCWPFVPCGFVDAYFPSR